MLTPDESAALLAPLSDAGRILLAVSGGPDSMALLHMVARRREGMSDPPRVFAATVDHGLRPESAAEARMVGAFAHGLGAPHAVLTWTGDKPRAGVQAAAREARYRLLCAEAARIGADALVTAHHADDQAETILMRLARGGSIGGLAGMRPAARRGALLVLRPLLGVPKAALVAYCEAHSIDFAMDPANADPRYERARLRAAAPALARVGLDAAALGRLASRAARAEDALAALAAQAAERFSPGRGEARFEASMAELAALPLELALRLVGAEAIRVGAGAAPRLERLERAVGRLLDAWRAGRGETLTLAGARIALRADGALVLTREGARKRGVRGGERACSVHVFGAGSSLRGAGRDALPLATEGVAPRLDMSDPAREVGENHPRRPPAGSITGTK